MLQLLFVHAMTVYGFAAALPLVEGLELHWIAIGALFGTCAGVSLAGIAAYFHLKRSMGRMNRDLSNYEAAVAMRFASLEKSIASQSQQPAAPSFARLAQPEPQATVPVQPGNVISLNAARPGGLQEKRLRITQAQLEEAVQANAVSAWFQPVVSLPERRPKYLVGFPYLETDTGTPAPPEQWHKAALRAGLGAPIDRQMVLHSIRAARELRRGDKKCGVIWNMGVPLLRDGSAFSEVEGLLKANRALGNSFVCQIECSEYRQLTHAEVEKLYHLRECGFRLGIGTSSDLSALSNALGSGLFSLACIQASVLSSTGASAIRNGSENIELVATAVTDEQTAIALIDHDILLAQGPLFGPVRPLRNPKNSQGAPEALR